jgi:hypothetical protein
MTDAERRRRFKAERRRQIEAAIAIQSETYREMVRHLEEARDRIAAALAVAPSSFESWRLRGLQVRAALALFERGATAVLTTGLDRSWVAGSDLVVAPLSASGIEIRGLLPALDPRLLDAIKAYQVAKIRDISTSVVARVTSELTQAAIGVQSPWEAATKIAGELERPKPQALTIVRTELGTVYSEAGQQRMEQAVKAGVKGLAKLWRRSGKLHPRLTHELADGQIVDVDKPFIVGGVEIPKPRDPSIPAGERINCGCQSLPHMRHWKLSTPGERAYTAEEIAASPTKGEADRIRRADRQRPS